jgi:protein SCO1
MRKPILYALAALLAGGIGLAAWQLTPVPHATGVSTAQALVGGPFALTDQNGQPVNSADFQGRYLLIYFGYTTCPDICPTELTKMSAALTAFEALDAGRGKQIVPLFITVDPERDTVAALKQYVPSFHPRLVGLTGTPAQINVAMTAYRTYAKKQLAAGEPPENYLMDHTSLMYLMGPDGHYLAHFTNANTVAQMTDGLKAFVQ